MSYQQMSDDYRSPEFRLRGEMCVKEQALILVDSDDAPSAALARMVVGGDWTSIEAVLVAVAVGPDGAAAVTDDGALLSSVQSVWPVVGAAKFPQLVV